MVLGGNPQCGLDVNCGSHILERLTFVFDHVGWRYPYKVFDNSVETYATDYLLGCFMVYGCLTVRRDALPSPLRTWTVTLLALYALSVFSGGLSHQFFTTPEGAPVLGPESAARSNSPAFRVLWSVCVGSVCAAGAAQGAIACRMASVFNPNFENGAGGARRLTKGMGLCVGAACGALVGGLFGTAAGATLPGAALAEALGAPASGSQAGAGAIPISLGLVVGLAAGAVAGAVAGAASPKGAVGLVTHSLGEAAWCGWALALLWLTWAGGLSMLRPAADIFVAGFTQAFPTLHILAVWVANLGADARPGPARGGKARGGKAGSLVSPAVRLTLVVGIFLNAPLIVLYPLALSFMPGLSEAHLNAALHSWLTLAWGLQWWSLKKVCQAYGPLFEENERLKVKTRKAA